MKKRLLPALFAGLASLLPIQAFASFHLMKVVEVFPGTPSTPAAQYVNIQMYAGSQNFVSGHKITIFNGAGTVVGTFTFTAAVANGINQRKILIATPEAVTRFGVSADLTMTNVIELAGGKACFDAIPEDCVAWGNFANTTGVGTPILQNGGLQLGIAIKRNLGANGTLESTDDTNNSATDFFIGAPTPANNANQVGVAGNTCGNGNVEDPEQCDDNNTTAGDGCNATCQDEFCGDGIDNDGVAEACDDGNSSNTDACTTSCLAARCGDTFVQAGVETCDDGNQLNNDGCSSICTIEILASCGNGVIDAVNNENCDDSNTNNNDGCSSICRTELCGDNITQTNEECDGGIGNTTDDCSDACALEICGDGIINNGDECDDGNAVNNDACNNLCIANFCGDGAINNGEQCDDSNEDPNDGCDPGCVSEICGDGVTQSDPNRPEQCDDGNAINTDDCLNDCSNAQCGDGQTQSGIEDCDDGNLTNGDGCEDDCTVTQPEPEPKGLCSVNVTSSGSLASLFGLFGLFGLAALFLRRKRS